MQPTKLRMKLGVMHSEIRSYARMHSAKMRKDIKVVPNQLLAMDKNS